MPHARWIFYVYGVWHQFLLDLQLWNGVSVMHIHQWSNSGIPLKAHINMPLTLTSDSLVHKKMIVGMARARRITTMARTTLSATTAGRRSVLSGQEPVERVECNEKHESIWLTIWEIGYNTLIVILCSTVQQLLLYKYITHKNLPCQQNIRQQL